jgi:ATP synthase F1 epsilon subunit
MQDSGTQGTQESRKTLESSNPGFPESSRHDFQFELLTPEAVVLRDRVREVVVPGADGYFGVMAKHAHFVTTLKPGMLTVKRDGQSRVYDVRGGVVQVTPEKVVICAESAKLTDVEHR